MDIEKTFDSLDHDFLVTVLYCQLSCVINEGNINPYFNLKKGACQADPLSAYLFIIALEVLFVFIKSNENIKGI